MGNTIPKYSADSRIHSGGAGISDSEHLSIEELLNNAATLDVFQHYFPDFKKLKQKFPAGNSKAVNIYLPENGSHYLVKDFTGKEFDKVLNILGVIQLYEGCDFPEAINRLKADLGYIPNSYTRKARPQIQSKPVYLPIEPEPEAEIIPVDDKFWQSIIPKQNSNFHLYAYSLGVTPEHLSKWLVGSEQKGNTVFTMFGHQDSSGQKVNIKRVSFKNDGHRDKKTFPHSLTPPSKTTKYGQCLYGEHQLREGFLVILVESEKTAAIASFKYPQYDFLATGGAKGLTQSKIETLKLKGKKGYVLNDADEAGRNYESYKKLKEAGLDFVAVDLFPERTDGYDLADAIGDGLRPDLEDIRFHIKPEKVDTFCNESLKKSIPESVYLLKPGQTLSDLELPLNESQYLASPTGSGKTFYTLNSGLEMDFLVPTQAQTKQIAHEYQVNYVMEGLQPTDNSVNVGTYNAIDKLTALGRNTSDRTLVIDEAHNLALSASENFRGELMNEILDKAPQYKSILALSGTPVPSCHPSLKDLKAVSVKYEKPANKTLKAVLYKHQLTSVISRLERGRLNVVVLQNKNQSAQYAEHLEGLGFKTQCFNADTKEQDGHREIIESCNVNQDVEVLFVTSLFFEGLNIYNTNVGSIHILSRLSEFHIEQLYNRFRKQQPTCLYLYFSENANINQAVKFNWEQKQAEYISMAANWLRATADICKVGGENSDLEAEAERLINGLMGDRRLLFRKRGNSIEINYLGIDHLIVKDKINANYANFELFREALENYSFSFEGFEQDNITSKPETTESLQAIRTKQQEKKEEVKTEILDKFQEAGQMYVYHIDKHSNDTNERDMAYKVMRAEKYVGFDQAIQLLRECGSDSQWQLLERQLKVQRFNQLKEKSIGFNNADIALIDKIYATFKVGDTVSPEEILKRFCTIKNTHIKTQLASYTKTIATRLLKQFFEVERVSVKKDGKVFKQYKVLSNNPLKVKILESWNISAVAA